MKTTCSLQSVGRFAKAGVVVAAAIACITLAGPAAANGADAAPTSSVIAATNPNSPAGAPSNGADASPESVANAGNAMTLVALSTLPEPSPFAMLLAGVGMIAFIARRRIGN